MTSPPLCVTVDARARGDALGQRGAEALPDA